MRELSRRDLLGRALVGGGALTVGPALLGVTPRARAAVPAPFEVHLTLGRDPARGMTVSWSTTAGVPRPRVRYGPASARDLGATQDADTVSVLDRDPRVPVFLQAETITHHAELDGLAPSTDYVYEILQEGSTPVAGTFRTAPIGRTGFRFTAFGDQGTGDASDTLGAPQGRWIVDQVEQRDPLFHLHLGDLVYANINPPGTRNAAWTRFMVNDARSARLRPWMPILGNHEIENGMGPFGYDAYLGRFRLPDNASITYAGHWYAFTVGSVRVVAVDTEDWSYQKGGDLYLRGYSRGAQLAWLDRELAGARASPDIDWVIVLAHHLTVSSANLNGSDLGLREQLQPLVDRHGVAWCCPATITTTSARSRCAAPIRAPSSSARRWSTARSTSWTPRGAPSTSCSGAAAPRRPRRATTPTRSLPASRLRSSTRTRRPRPPDARTSPGRRGATSNTRTDSPSWRSIRERTRAAPPSCASPTSAWPRPRPPARRRVPCPSTASSCAGPAATPRSGPTRRSPARSGAGTATAATRGTAFAPASPDNVRAVNRRPKLD